MVPSEGFLFSSVALQWVSALEIGGLMEQFHGYCCVNVQEGLDAAMQECKALVTKIFLNTLSQTHREQGST